MATMTISLPEPMREFVEAEVSSGNYGSASELFRELVRERQKRISRAFGNSTFRRIRKRSTD